MTRHGDLGTPQYMAPEQVEGRAGDVDATTDQFALAVIAHELLTGKNAFASESIGETFALVRSGVLPPTGLGAAVDRVLARALSQEKCPALSFGGGFAEAFRAAALPPAPVALTPLPVAVVVAGSVPARRVPARRARRRGRDVRLGVAAAAAIAITSFLGTGAANRVSARKPAGHGAPTAAVADAEATAARGGARDQLVAAPPAPATVAPTSLASFEARPRPAVRAARASSMTIVRC